MTVLFVGSEIESFDLYDINQEMVTTAGRHDSDFARGSIELNGGPDGTGIAKDFTGQTSVWLHFNVNPEWNADTNYDHPVAILHDTVSGEDTLRLEGLNGNLHLQYWNGATYTSRQGIADFQLTTDVVQRVDIECVIHDTTGRFAVYVNEVLMDEFTGDTNLYASAQVDRIYLKGPTIFRTTDEEYWFSEVVVADESTVGWRVATLAPTGVGTTGAWTGLWSDVDEVIADDTDFIDSDTANQVETFATGNLSVAASAMEVVALVVNARVRKGSSGPAQVQLAVNSGVTDYFSATMALDPGFIPIQNIWETDPDTAAPWTVSGVDAVEIGVKSIT